MDIFNPISLDDPEFFRKLNAAKPELFNQKEMEKNIRQEELEEERKRDNQTKICPGCHFPYKLGRPYMGEMCNTEGKCNE